MLIFSRYNVYHVHHPTDANKHKTQKRSGHHGYLYQMPCQSIQSFFKMFESGPKRWTNEPTGWHRHLSNLTTTEAKNTVTLLNVKTVVTGCVLYISSKEGHAFWLYVKGKTAWCNVFILDAKTCEGGGPEVGHSFRLASATLLSLCLLCMTIESLC